MLRKAIVTHHEETIRKVSGFHRARVAKHALCFIRHTYAQNKFVHTRGAIVDDEGIECDEVRLKAKTRRELAALETR